MLGSLAKKQSTPKADPALVSQLYKTVAALSRAPVFYTSFAVPDTVDGRFDMLCLSLSLVLFRVQQGAPETAQALFDLAFNDIELGLREAGIGDLGVPKHMKKMMQAFYGRAASYYEALEQRDEASLSAILERNLYSGRAVPEAAGMSEWVSIIHNYLHQIDVQEFIRDPHTLETLVPPAIDK